MLGTHIDRFVARRLHRRAVPAPAGPRLSVDHVLPLHQD
jgi:hypothetical protein